MRKFLSICFLSLSLLCTMATAQAKSPADTAPRDTLFLDASIDNRTPFVGQEVILTYSLYFRNIAPRISDYGKEEHAGLWVQETAPEGYIRSTPATVGGMTLRKAVVKQLRLVPMQPGKLSVTNYRLRCFLPATSAVGLDNHKDVEVMITAPNAEINAKPLPPNAPEGFSGAVGDFTMALSSDRFQVHAGEPLTFSIKISGKGNLKAFPQVALTVPSGFRQQEASVPTVTQASAGHAVEDISTSISLTAEQPGTFRFTPVRMTAFNPLKGRYETISSGDISVRVTPPEKSVSVKAPDSLPAPVADRNSWVPPVTITAMSAAVLLLIAVLYALGARNRKRGTVPAVQEPAAPVRPSTPQGIQPVESLRGRLYEALRTAGVQNPGGMTSQQLDTTLKGLKVKPACSESLLELMRLIDQATYTPGQTSGETLEALNRKTDTVLDSFSKRCAP
jgi:hypothetical protein